MTKTIYDPVAIFFHWVIGVGIIGLLALGMYMSDLPPSDPTKWPSYDLHKAVGVIVFGLVILRILWRGLNPPPAALTSQAKWERVLAHVIHMLLYIGMVLMPISGYVMSSAGGHAISIFGMINVPLLIDKNEALGHIAQAVHGLGGNLMVAAVLLHVAGAVKHHLIDRDSTMTRMIPCIKPRG